MRRRYAAPCPLRATLCVAAPSRISGEWQDEDYDVFDGERKVGRIYRVNAAHGAWFWTNRTSYGHADSLEEAKSAFRAEYAKWQREA